MKKLISILFLSFLTLSSNLFSMENENNQENKIEKQSESKSEHKLSKKDMVKIGAATLGCAFFAIAFLGSYQASKLEDKELTSVFGFNENKTEFRYIPAYLWAISLGAPLEVLVHNIFVLSGISAGVLAGGLGWYVWNKLSKLSSEQVEDGKKD